jgi:hypothetical protein
MVVFGAARIESRLAMRTGMIGAHVLIDAQFLATDTTEYGFLIKI